MFIFRSDGTVLVNSNVTEHGTGQWSNFHKMVAEVLQLPLDRVTSDAVRHTL